MPEFANVAAHAVIDTFALLMWHQIFFSRLCHETLQWPHLQSLIRYYFSQCQPLPLPILGASFLTLPEVSVMDVAQIDHLA